MKVAVLFGGVSSEREISLESGRHIYNSLDRSKYQVLPIFVDSKLHFWQIEEHLIWMNATKDVERALPGNSQRVFYEDLPNIADFCFLGLHGKFVEDGALQGMLELIDMPYNGPGILGASIGMDKIFQKTLLKEAGIPYAPHVVVNCDVYSQPVRAEALHDQIAKELGFPCIVKPSREGCSTGLSKVKNAQELPGAILKALEWDENIMAEKFMDMMEVTCTVLGNEAPTALLPTETPSKGDFLTIEEKFLPGDATMITPPRVPAEDVKKMQDVFVKAYKAMHLESYTRIDGFWDAAEKKLYINEPNTLPGVTPSTHVFHQAAEAGMDAPQFFDRVIELSLSARRRPTSYERAQKAA